MSTTSLLWQRFTRSHRAALLLLLVAVALIMPPAYNSLPATAQIGRFTAALPLVMRPYPDGLALVKTFTSISTSSKVAILGNTLYFFANFNGMGYELWKSDGTTQGTERIEYSFLDPDNLTIMDDTLYFTTRNELWKSDGTTQGTGQVKYFWHEACSNSSLKELIMVNSTLYFTACDSRGRELWKSDGTAQGTSLVKDIRTGSESSFSDVSYEEDYLIAMGDMLLFVASDGVSGKELWKSDGTDQGTTLVKDIRPGPDSTFTPDKPYFTVVGTTLYFSADDGISGRELWKSNGTAQGTSLVKDIRPGSLGSTPYEPMIAGDALYFIANDGMHISGLWKSDGTAQGTTLIKDFSQDWGGNRLLITVGDTLYFATGTGLWKSDGTAQGTVQFKTLEYYSGCVYFADPVLINDMLYFAAYSSNGSGIALWKSDGSEQGTMPVKLLNQGLPNNVQLYARCAGLFGVDIYLTTAGSQLFFPAYFTPSVGCSSGRCAVSWKDQLFWRSDGTEQGTIPITVFLERGLVLSQPPIVIVLGDMLYLFTRDSSSNYQLWRMPIR